jgi:SapC
MTKQLLIYESAVPVSAGRHAGAAFEAGRDYAFSSGINAVPLMAVEFIRAATEYAIVFATAGDEVIPTAVLGLKPQQNLYLSPDAQWQASYVPAFIRRYPFVSGRGGVLIDSAWRGWSSVEGEPLFDAQGRATPVLRRALALLEDFDAQAQRTRAVCARLAALDLFKPMQADATLPDGRLLTVEGFRVIDEDRLQALPDAVVLELHRDGLLKVMHLQIASLATMRHLIERKARREQSTQRGAGDGSQ